MSRRIACLLAVILALLLNALPAQAATRYVNVGNGAPLSPYTNWVDAATNIQQAIDVSGDGDLVLVTNGTYVAPAQIVVTGAVVLKSVNGRNVTIVDGQTSNRCFYLSHSNAVLDGFTLTRGYTTAGGGGASIQAGQILNCRVVSNTCSAAPAIGGGLLVGNGVRVSNCAVSANQSLGYGFGVSTYQHAYGGGIYCTGACVIAGCFIDGNIVQGGPEQYTQRRVGTGRGGGIYCGAGSEIIGCTIQSNTAKGGNIDIYIGAEQGRGGGIEAAGPVMVRDCAILKNLANGGTASAQGSGGAGYGGGIDLQQGGILRNCLIQNNGVASGWGSQGAANSLGAGVFLSGTTTVESCTIAGNGYSPALPYRGGGVYAESAVAFTNSILSGNVAAGDDNYGGNASLYAFGFSCVTPPAPSGGPGNVYGNPLLEDNQSDGHLTSNSPCVNAGTNAGWMAGAFDLDGNSRIRGGRVDMGALETDSTHPPIALSNRIYCVSSSSTTPAWPYETWAAAATSITQVVLVMSDGDTIVVTNGTYPVQAQIDLSVGVRLQSVNGPAVTIIDGQNSNRCVYLAHTNAVVDGFTVTRGRSTEGGGGIYCTTGRILNCIVVSNCSASPGGKGGGIRAGSNVEISNCVVRGNSASPGSVSDCHAQGGGIYCGTNCLLVDCVVEENVAQAANYYPTAGSAYGGGIFCEGDVRINGSSVLSNQANGSGGLAMSPGAGLGGGVYGRGRMALWRCVIQGNTALAGSGTGIAGGPAAGGGVHCQSAGITNCLLAGNQATGQGYVSHEGEPHGAAGYGGGIFCQNDVRVENCIIGGNTATFMARGGGVFASTGAVVTIMNSIVQSNAAEAGTNYDGVVAITFTNSCTRPLPGGPGNMDADPQFASVAGGDFRLLGSSPCVNAGTNQDWMTGAIDLAGHPRLGDSIVDMGAYELFFTAYGIPADWQARYSLPTNGSMDYWDSDSDGFLNWQEYQADSDPTNGASFLPPLTDVEGIEVLTIGASPTSTGRVYDIYCKTNLLPETQPWTAVGELQAGNGSNLVFTVTNIWPTSFYRIGVRTP